MSELRLPPVPPPKPVAAAVAPDAAKAMTLFVMVVAALYFGKEVLVPVTLALFLAFLLAPLVALLRRVHFGRVPSVLAGVVMALALIVAIGGVILTQIGQLTNNLPQYAETVEAKIQTVQSYTVGRLADLADRIGPKAAQPGASAPAQGKAANGQAPTVATIAAPPSDSSGPLQLAERYLSTVLSPFATLGIVFVVTVFALLQQEDLRDRLIRLLGSDDLHRTTIAIDDGARRLSKYFLTQLTINSAFGIIIGLGLLIIGVPNPVLWAVLSGLLRFVPYVGALISAVLPMTLAAAVEPGWSMALWTAGLYLCVEGITGQFIEPTVYGHSTGLSPFSVVVAAIFWSWLWGPVGLILSTPLTLVLVVLGRHVQALEFLDVMLGDRPALTPIESFYQRVLAGDADEAEDHAELLMKDRSLSTYYDEVALKGLQLAANDAERGALDADQLTRVKETVLTLIQGLHGHEDKQPAAAQSDDGAVELPEAERNLPRNPDPQGLDPAAAEALPESWRTGTPVLCIAGRGALDEPAAAMLAQLLGKHRLGARLASYDAVSRDKINELDVSGVAMACISYLEISGSPAHLRYLMQRLRRRLPPGTPILVGLWPPEDSALKDPKIQAQVGADYFISSLEEAVSACTDAALKAEASQPRVSDRVLAAGSPDPPGGISPEFAFSG